MGIALMVAAATHGAEPIGALATDAGQTSYRATRLQADTLRIGRADTMDGLQHAWATAFHRLNPTITFELRDDTRLSAEAFDALLAARIDIAPFVREPFPAELTRFREKF